MEKAYELYLALGLLALMCTAGKASKGDQDGSGQTLAMPKVLCDACLRFSAEAQLILSDPEMQRLAVEALRDVACQSLTGKMKDQCFDLVNENVVDFMMEIHDHLEPEICTEARLCPRDYVSTSGRVVETGLANAKTCRLCQDIAKDVLSYFRSNSTNTEIAGALHLVCSKLGEISTECDLLVDVYALDLMEHLEDSSPEEICEMAHLCNPTKKGLLVSGSVKRDNCFICQFVVLELKLKLRDPGLQEKLVDVFMSGCGRLKNHVDECQMIVSQYGPFILANLDTILEADALCAKMGACTAQKVAGAQPVIALYSDRRAHHNLHVL